MTEPDPPLSTPARRGFDSARTAREEDHLNRWPFAREIYRVAVDGPRDWSVRIGVYGEWGSGKTSVLRFIESMAEKEGHIVFSFNPWQFQSPDDLWKAFVKGIFSRIREATGEAAPGELMRRGKSVVSGAAKAIPKVVGIWSSDLGAAAETGLGFARKYLAFSESDLKNLKEVLCDRRLVVTVDDLDRTEAQLVPEILFALKEIMDVPGVSFVCAFDPVVVGQVLGVGHPGFGDGLKFLDKIIDYPRWLLEPNTEQLTDLARSDAETICPYVPSSNLSDAVALLPKNPRSIRQFIRLLGLLGPQIERHHPTEIHWPILLTANVLKVRFPRVGQTVLGDNAFWQNIYGSTFFGEAKEEKRQQAISEKVNAVLSGLTTVPENGFSENFAKCIAAISSRINAWHGINFETLFYQFHLAEAPYAVTWKEFDSFVEKIGHDYSLGSKAVAWIKKHGEDVCQSLGKVYSELLSAAIGRRAEHQSRAADAMPGKEMNAELDQADRLLRIIEMLMFKCDAFDGQPWVIEPEHLTLLFDQVRQYFGWRRTSKYRAARKKESALLTKLFEHDASAIEPWIKIVGISQWEGSHADHGPEWKKLITKFRKELKERCSRWIIEQFPSRAEFVQQVIRHEEHGHRYCGLFLERTGPIWTIHRKMLLRAIRPDPDNPTLQNNAYDTLSWLQYLIENGGDEGKAATNVLSDTDFALQLWRAAVAAPLNPRAVGSLRTVHEYLLSIGVSCKTPPWWIRIVKGLSA